MKTLPSLLTTLSTAALLSSCADMGMVGMMPPPMMHGAPTGPRMLAGSSFTSPAVATLARPATGAARFTLPTAPVASFASRPMVGSSDYAPHLLQSYRAGYRYGKADRLSGFPRDYHNAFLASGEAWESYFQEGYGHGYELQGEQH
jgi:hypothetical protein